MSYFGLRGGGGGWGGMIVNELAGQKFGTQNCRQQAKRANRFTYTVQLCRRSLISEKEFKQSLFVRGGGGGLILARKGLGRMFD